MTFNKKKYRPKKIIKKEALTNNLNYALSMTLPNFKINNYKINTILKKINKKNIKFKPIKK